MRPSRSAFASTAGNVRTRSLAVQELRGNLEIQASVEGEHSVASVGGILREDAGAAGSAGQRDQAEVWTRQTKRGLQKSEGIVLHLTGIS